LPKNKWKHGQAPTHILHYVRRYTVYTNIQGADRMEVIVPAMKILGIAIAADLTGKALEERGQGGKVVFVKLLSHVACAYIVVDLLRDAFSYMVHVLGVIG